MSDQQVPFTVLTGFLGAGKTTVLNRVLSRPQGRRIAVLVNELGRIAIDSKLILSRGGDVLELAGGCVCCKVDIKNDLWDGIVDVVRRSRPDHVVLETTGVAEPDAILEGLERLPDGYREHIAVAGIACVIDARAAAAQLERHDEARAQIEAADRLMYSKLDLATEAELASARHSVRALNPHADVASFPDGEEGTASLVPWLLERARAGAGDRRRARPGQHRHGQLVAVAFGEDAPLAGDALLELVRGLGERLVRVKGYVHLIGGERGFLELAGGQLELRPGGPWTGPPRTELVFIGEGLDDPSLRRGLWACRAGGSR
ncbi:MAG TPA: GTP-binding protein [Kofleriaceae bacterium]|nr:GTP-binding protein [Kofleriaceae bacterium]